MKKLQKTATKKPKQHHQKNPKPSKTNPRQNKTGKTPNANNLEAPSVLCMRVNVTGS